MRLEVRFPGRIGRGVIRMMTLRSTLTSVYVEVGHGQVINKLHTPEICSGFANLELVRDLSVNKD